MQLKPSTEIFAESAKTIADLHHFGLRCTPDRELKLELANR